MGPWYLREREYQGHMISARGGRKGQITAAVGIDRRKEKHFLISV